MDRLMEVWVSCKESVLEFFFFFFPLAQPHILFKRSRSKLVLTWNLGRSAAESAASNERLVQVSNKRITSFWGLSKDKWVSERSLGRGVWTLTFHRWKTGLVWRGGLHPHPHPHPPRRSVRQGTWHLCRSPSEEKQTWVSFKWKFFFILTFPLGANQDDSRLSFCNHLTGAELFNGGRSVDPSNLSELNEIHHRSG